MKKNIETYQNIAYSCEKKCIVFANVICSVQVRVGNNPRFTSFVSTFLKINKRNHDSPTEFPCTPSAIQTLTLDILLKYPFSSLLLFPVFCFFWYSFLLKIWPERQLLPLFYSIFQVTLLAQSIVMLHKKYWNIGSILIRLWWS